MEVPGRPSKNKAIVCGSSSPTGRGTLSTPNTPTLSELAPGSQSQLTLGHIQPPISSQSARRSPTGARPLPTAASVVVEPGADHLGFKPTRGHLCWPRPRRKKSSVCGPTVVPGFVTGTFDLCLSPCQLGGADGAIIHLPHGYI